MASRAVTSATAVPSVASVRAAPSSQLVSPFWTMKKTMSEERKVMHVSKVPKWRSSGWPIPQPMMTITGMTKRAICAIGVDKRAICGTGVDGLRRGQSVR